MLLRLRRGWLAVHRWIGLSFGLVLLLSGITGSLLVLARPLDRALHPDFFAAPASAAPALQPVVERLRAEFGPEATLDLRLPAPGETLQVSVSGAWNGVVFIDPASGREQGRRGGDEGFFNLLFEFHSQLMGGDTGRAVLACAAVAYLGVIASGLVLWWPARRAWRLRTRAGTLVTLVHVHRWTGVLIGPVILVSVASGAYLAWRPMADWVNWLGGTRLTSPPAQRIVDSPATGHVLSVDESVAQARAMWPGSGASVVRVGPRTVTASRVRMRLEGDSHPIGMSTVAFDPATGALKSARRWDEREPGVRAFSVVYPLHSAGLFGTVHLIVVFLAGVTLTTLGISGLWVWGRRSGWRRATELNFSGAADPPS